MRGCFGGISGLHCLQLARGVLGVLSGGFTASSRGQVRDAIRSYNASGVLVACGGGSDSVSSGLVLLFGDHSLLAGL